jgi:hypothetical protein
MTSACLAEFVKCHVDLLGPFQGITHQGTPQGVDVVDGGHDIFGSPEGLEVREIGVHLGRCLGAWCILELHAHTVHREGLKISFDDHIGWDETQVAGGRVFTDRLVHMPKGTARQQYAVLEKQAAAHGVAGIDVFRYGMVHETDRSDHLDLAAADIGFVIHDPRTPPKWSAWEWE